MTHGFNHCTTKVKNYTVKPNRLLYPLLAFILISLIIFIANKFEYTYTISSKGLIYPSQEWVLARTSDGNLVNSLRDNYHNTISEYTVTEFQRGDLAGFILMPDLFQRQYISKGDTIGIMSSQTERRRHSELTGELMRQRKLLSVYASGERPQDISIAYERMVLARTEYETQKRITERNQVLFERRHIPEEEYEISEKEYAVKKQNYLIARNQYEALQAGAKQEQLDFISSNIQAIEKQIEMLEELMGTFVITSPISGKIIRQQGNNGSTTDALIRVASTDNYVIMVPVNLYQVPHLSAGQKLSFQSHRDRRIYTATITGFDNAVQMIDGRQKLFVIASIDNNIDDMSFYPNMLKDVTISSEPLSLREYLLRLVNEVYNN